MPGMDEPPAPISPDAPVSPVVDAYESDRQRRHAARRHFLAAPAYCIAFDAEGRAVLCEKCYEYWPNRDPEDATIYRPLSRHVDLEEAERRLRLLCGGPIYYDESGRVVREGPSRKRVWGVPTDDD